MNILFQILLINIFYDQQSQCNNFLWSYPIYVFFHLQTNWLFKLTAGSTENGKCLWKVQKAGGLEVFGFWLIAFLAMPIFIRKDLF